MKASGAPLLSANRPDGSRLTLLETALISSGILCKRGSDSRILLDVRAGVFSVSASQDDSRLTLAACLPLTGYMKGERPLQQLLYSVGKAVPGVRWVITTTNVHLIAERLAHSTSADDSIWIIGASHLLDQAMMEVDTQARLQEHSLWHFANIRSVAP